MALERLPNPRDGFEAAVRWLLVGLLAFMPLAFGVVHAWSEEVVIVLSSTMVVCLLLRGLVHPDGGLIWTWAYVPLAVLLLLAVLQLLPLPVRWVRILSPSTASLKTDLLGNGSDAGAGEGAMTLTFYPHATIHDLRLVLAAVGVFIVVVHVFHDVRQILWLLKVVAAVGGLVATVTLAQYLFGNGKFYWLIPSRHYQGLSGPFVNHSHYGQFMNLSIGAALGLVLVRLREVPRDTEITSQDLLTRRIPRVPGGLCLLLVGIALAAATVFLSLTRGGVIGILVAGGFTAFVLCARRSMRGYAWILLIITLAGLPCVLYTGFDAVYGRLASLQNPGEIEAGRWQILKDIAATWTRFPLFGTGLGTHSVVYPMNDHSVIVPRAAYAENEYAQVLEEMGLLGLGALATLGVIVGSSYVKTVRHGAAPICAAAYGLGFGLLAILIHSLSDFGQHLPANGTLSATFCALLLVLSQHREGHPMRQERSRAWGLRVAIGSAFLPGVLILSAWAVGGADAARAAQSHRRQCVRAEESLAARNWQGASEEYLTLISHAATACAHEPGNAEYRFWLNVYRWRWISRMIDPNGVEVAIPERFLPAVREVVAGFHEACALCPTFGPAYSAAGQIEKFVFAEDRRAQMIQTGYRLAPCDPLACLVAGYLDAVEGRHEAALGKFTRAVRLDGRLFREVAHMYLRQLSRPDLALACAGDDIERLRYVSGALEEMAYLDLAEQAVSRERDLLEARCQAGDASAGQYARLGTIHRQQGRPEAAIACYRRALDLDYGQVEWRLELAEVLAQTGSVLDAMGEARICLDLRPGCDAAQALVKDFALHRTVLNRAAAP